MSYASSRATEHARRPVEPAEEQDTFQLTTGTAGDHPAVHQFLLAVFHQPSLGEFQAQLDEPSYEPNDRLLAKRSGHIVGHVRTVNREVLFGECILPVSTVCDLATLPEFRGRGCGSNLLELAERRMLENGAVVGLLRTKAPQFYEKRGWARCGGQRCSTAAPRHILSRLSEVESQERSPLGIRPSHLHIRFWRHVEQAALGRLYEEGTRGAFGPFVRSEAYWRWLISRRAYDRIYIAIEGSPKLDLDDTMHSVVGYAFSKEGRIVELMTAERRSDAAWRLLARACGDAIENDEHEIRLDAVPGHPLHQMIIASGGVNRCTEDESGHVSMVKLLNVERLISLLKTQLHRRAVEGRLTIPGELGLLIDGCRYVLEITRRSVKLSPGRFGRSYLECDTAELTQLLLGNLGIEEAVATGKLTASTRVALEAARVLLPQVPLWYPPLDDLPA
ncbi:MAG: GNAT family N-acetyltransferase [Planctomycetes bacterium]|nr:GNAT family N-acetyltransferase [Planctomycetota bacterium]MBL7037696.1 GNAT family N-acetyltransferase [Pirellulaceae bacterium]